MTVRQWQHQSTCSDWQIWHLGGWNQTCHNSLQPTVASQSASSSLLFQPIYLSNCCTEFWIPSLECKICLRQKAASVPSTHCRVYCTVNKHKPWLLFHCISVSLALLSCNSPTSLKRQNSYSVQQMRGRVQSSPSTVQPLDCQTNAHSGYCQRGNRKGQKQLCFFDCLEI